MRDQTPQSRRSFLSLLAAAGAGTLVSGWGMPRVFAQGSAPPLITPEATRPTIPYGVASGDVTDHSAIIWSRTDRPGRMFVEYATTESFKNPRRVQGPAALALDDFTARVDLTGLPPGQEIFYRVAFQDLSAPKVLSTPAVGHFRTAPAERRDLTLAWGGDTAGQGWGINPEWGGMKIYEQMRRLDPDCFIHCGDYIYADGPLRAEVKLDDGTVWKNVTIPEKTKVAETLAEFRGNYVYNLLDDHGLLSTFGEVESAGTSAREVERFPLSHDAVFPPLLSTGTRGKTAKPPRFTKCGQEPDHVRRFNAAVGQLIQWDDHETTNNWFPGGVIDERHRLFHD